MNIESKTIRLRLVNESDAEFILSLRTDERYNRFLSTVSVEINAQVEWIKKYKIDEGNSNQFYFIIERLDGTPCGTVRIYDLKDDSFCWGSWILNDNKTHYSALESAFLVYSFGFNYLGFSKAHFDVMKENKKVISFHEKMGAIKVAEDDDNEYFEITKERVLKATEGINLGFNSANYLKTSFGINEIHIGMSYSYTHLVTEIDVIKFAEVSGDDNPLHLDESYAQQTRFKGRIAHGMLTASFFSAVLGTKFPGKGSIYISQSLEFKRPVYLGDVVAVSVVVKSVDIKRKRVVLDTLCYVLGKVTTTGSAELFIP